MRAGQQSTGHPINVATGIVYSVHRDCAIPGKVELVWERRYSTALLGTHAGPMGQGWTTRYFATLTRDRDSYHFATPEGDVETFVDPEGRVERGLIVRNLGTFQELFKTKGRYVVVRWDSDTDVSESYVFRQGPPGEPWPLETIRDVRGNALEISFDMNGRLTSVRQRAEGRTLVVHYGSDNRITQLSLHRPGDAVQPLSTYEYDRAGRLAAVANALGHVDRYEYDALGRMTREILADGAVFSFKYDRQGRCVRSWGRDGFDDKILRYRDSAGWTEVENSLGHTTLFKWNSTAQVVEEIDPLGGLRRTEYDEHGRIVGLISPMGAQTHIEYDAEGNRAAIITPTGARYEFRYNLTHLPVTLTDANGHVWTREYDEGGRITATVDAMGNRCSYAYDISGNLVEVTSPVGTRRRYAYTQDGTLHSTTNWTGDVTRFEFDAWGRLLRRTDALNQSTHFQYDLLGNIVRMERPDGSQVTLTYDAGGELTTVTDGNGHVTRYRNGSCGRLLERVAANGDTTRYRWGTEPGRLEQIENERGETYSFEYDAAGRVIREVGFDGRSQEITYDRDGHRIAITNGNGETVTLVRDQAGRLIRITSADGTNNTFERDPAGHLIAARNADLAVLFERDALGRVTREAQGTVDVRSEYDALGNVIRLTSGLGHEAHYQVDGNGALVELDIVRQSIHFARNAIGQEVSRSVPGGLQFLHYYDRAGRVTAQRVLSGRNEEASRQFGSAARPLVNREYQYDRGGLLTSIQDSRWGSLTYRFDGMERLHEASWSTGPKETFRYDGTSNLISINIAVDRWHAGKRFDREADSDGAPVEQALSYGRGNRLLTHGASNFVYDGHGRLLRKVEHAANGEVLEWRYAWNALDQLSSVHCPDGATWTYRYDALGRRVAKEGPRENRRYVWDGEVLLHEQADEGGLVTWVFDPHSYVPFCKIEKNEVYSVFSDQLGTPQALFDTRGQLAWSGQYLAWGSLIRSSPAKVACEPRFQGQWFDSETGFHYHLYRYYDPQRGRFVSPDPIGLRGGTNLYSYVPNPTRWIDPLGLQGDIPLGGGWTGRVDRFNTAFGTDHEMHVFAPNGAEAGIHGSEGWFAKHGHPAAQPPDMPPHVANTITNIAHVEARRDGLLPEKGRADVTGDKWKDLVRAAKEKKLEEAKKAKECKSP